MNGKLLILDKSCFDSCNREDLRRLVSTHRVLISYLLCCECLISSRRDSRNYLVYIPEVIRNGGLYGCKPHDLVEWEKQHKRPVPSIVDATHGRIISTGELIDSQNFDMEAEAYYAALMPTLDCTLKVADTLYQGIVKTNLLNGMRDTDMHDKDVRFKKWVYATDSLMPEILQYTRPQTCRHITNDWHMWHSDRLRFILGLEWAYLKATGGGVQLNKKRAVHDLHDAQYVAYLSHADGVITNDKKLMIPLVKAAYPNKGLFGSIHEVPEQYHNETCGSETSNNWA